MVALKKLWHAEQNLHGAAGLLVVTLFLSNVLGFLRDVILANTIPLATLDSYYAAFRLPDFLFNLFILGAISSAFIPVFLRTRHESGEAAASQLANNLVHIALLVLLILGTLLELFMPRAMSALVPGFDAERLATTVRLARVLMLSPFFFAVSYVVGGILNAHKKFFAYALAPLAYNAAIITGGVLSLKFGIGAVAWAVVVGAALHLLIQLPALSRLGYRWAPVLNLGDAGFRRVVRLMVPRSVSLATNQIVLVAFTTLGSSLPKGAVSIFTLTNNFQTTPIAIFASSIATAVFPRLGSAASEGDDASFRRLLTASLSGMFFLIIPSMAFFWVFRAHLIRLYLALNHQTWGDTIRAITTFEWFILALLAEGFNLVIIRAFYARHDTLRPMVLSIIGGGTAIAAAAWITSFYPEVPALSLAFLIGVNLEALLLAGVFAAVHRGLIDGRTVAQTALVAGLLSLVAGAGAKLVLSVISDGLFRLIPALGTHRVLPLLVALLTAGAVGIGVFVVLASLLRRRELEWIWPRRHDELILEESDAIAGEEGLT